MSKLKKGERLNDGFYKNWIIETSIPIIASYGEELTLRGLHYKLIEHGMPNTKRHYKRIVAAISEARKDGRIPYSAFKDFERNVIGRTPADETDVYDKIETAEWIIQDQMTRYSKNRWENQPVYPEVFIEKNTQIGVFRRPCAARYVALSSCKGYPSLTYIYEASLRFIQRQEEGKRCVLLYFGDHDPSGDDIPRHLEKMLGEMGATVEVQRIALTKEQVIKWKLPPAPTKPGDTRGLNWDGVGQVEMDALDPKKMQQLLNDAIDTLFDPDLGEELDNQESTEREIYIERVREYIESIVDKDDE